MKSTIFSATLKSFHKTKNTITATTTPPAPSVSTDKPSRPSITREPRSQCEDAGGVRECRRHAAEAHHLPERQHRGRARAALRDRLTVDGGAVSALGILQEPS